jgi:hypothetical protein
MENSQIYESEEVPIRAEVKDENLGTELDKRCKEFTEAKTIDELSALYKAANKWLDSVASAETRETIDTIIKKVYTRSAIQITLDKSVSQAEMADGA